MKISNAINIIQNKKWTKINNYYIDIAFDTPIDGGKGPQDFAKMCGWYDLTPYDINTSLISVTTPNYANANVMQYVSYEWRFHQGRDEIYRFSMTFRDYNQMKLYNTFRTLYIKGKEQYYDKIKMNIKVNLAEDYGVYAMPIFQTTTAIIESVSQLQFSHNTENQIAEFTINFICNTTEVGGEATNHAGKTGIFEK